MYFKIVFFLLIGLYGTTAQTDITTKIIGTWELETIVGELENGAKDPLIDSDILLTFKKDSILRVEIEYFVLDATYTIENEIFTTGNKQYKIIFLDANTLSFKPNSEEIHISYNYKRKPKHE